MIKNNADNPAIELLAEVVRRAEALLRESSVRQGSIVLRGIEEEIQLTLEEIRRETGLQDTLRDKLGRAECYVGTELLQMEARTPRYSAFRYPEREKLQRRLLALDRERRQIEVKKVDRAQELERRLLAQLRKHGRLSGR